MNDLPRAHVSGPLFPAVATAAALMAAAGCSGGSGSPGGPGQEQADGGGAGGGPVDGSGADGKGGAADGADDGAASGGGGDAPGGGSDAESDADADETRSDAAVDADSGDAGAVCVTSAAKGSCGPYRYPAISGSDGTNTTVGQDVWNPITGWAQTLYARSPGNWYVTASMPAGNTAVVSFPNTGETYNSSPLTGFSSMYSSFSESMNQTSGTSAEAAYDIWLNDWNNEVMIQHEMVSRGGPCGPVLATVSFGGHDGVPVRSWILCKYGSEIIWQVAGTGDRYGVATGSVDILAMLEWLENNGGYLPQGSTLTAIGYGFEICSTGGVDEKFEVSAFSITSTP